MWPTFGRVTHTKNIYKTHPFPCIFELGSLPLRSLFAICSFGKFDIPLQQDGEVAQPAGDSSVCVGYIFSQGSAWVTHHLTLNYIHV